MGGELVGPEYAGNIDNRWVGSHFGSSPVVVSRKYVTLVLLTLVYRTQSGSVVPSAWLPWLVTVGLGIIVSPLALLVSYVARVATIARYTVAVGPLVPPEETFGGGNAASD